MDRVNYSETRGKRHFSDSDRLSSRYTHGHSARKMSSIDVLEDTLASLNQRIDSLSISSRPTLDSWESEYSSCYDGMSLKSGSSVDSCFSSVGSLDNTVVPDPRDINQNICVTQGSPDFSGRPHFCHRSFSTPERFPSVSSHVLDQLTSDLLGEPSMAQSCLNVVVSAELKSNHRETKRDIGWRTWLRGQSRLSLKDNVNRNKTKITVFDRAGGCQAVFVDERTTARDVVTMMVKRTQSDESIHWSIVEDVDLCRVERIIEDHELILAIVNGWTTPRGNKLVFRKDTRKNDPFIHPERLFSKDMKDRKSDRKKLTADAERAREILMMGLVVESDRIPDLQGNLYLKQAGESKWKKVFCYLRGSGLHYSTKGKTQDPKYLRCFSRLDDVDLYTVKRISKADKIPYRHCIMLKPASMPVGQGVRDVACICAKDEDCLLSWFAGLRIVKYGSALRQNFVKRRGEDVSFFQEKS